MRLTNSTDFDSRFLRRLVSWVARQIDLPMSELRHVNVTNSRCSSRGRAWRHRVLLRIGPADRFPREPFLYGGNITARCEDRIEGLISIASHELFHVWQYMQGHQGRLEFSAVWSETYVLNLFRKQRTDLLAAWTPTEAPAKPKRDVVSARAAKVSADLERWTRKLKLAQTKIRKLKQRARYYEKKTAAKGTR